MGDDETATPPAGGAHYPPPCMSARGFALAMGVSIPWVHARFREGMPSIPIADKKYVDLEQAIPWLEAADFPDGALPDRSEWAERLRVPAPPPGAPSRAVPGPVPRPAGSDGPRQQSRPTRARRGSGPRAAPRSVSGAPSPSARSTAVASEPLELRSLTEMARDLGVAERWLAERVTDGLPHMRLGERIVCVPGEVRAWLREHTPEPEPETEPRPLRLLRAREVAEEIQMSERWVREQVRLGMPHLKFGHSVRFDPEQTRAWLETRYARSRP